MIVERISVDSFQLNRMELPVTLEQLARFQAGELVQKVFPHLNATQREFLVSGRSVEEQQAMFGEDDSEDINFTI